MPPTAISLTTIGNRACGSRTRQPALAWPDFRAGHEQAGAGRAAVAAALAAFRAIGLTRFPKKAKSAFLLSDLVDKADMHLRTEFLRERTAALATAVIHLLSLYFFILFNENYFRWRRCCQAAAMTQRA